MSFIAIGAGLAGTAITAGVGAATQGPGPVQPVKLQYANDVQNMLMPLAMQGVSGWGTSIPQQYLHGSADQGNDLAHLFDDYYGSGAGMGQGAGQSFGANYGQGKYPNPGSGRVGPLAANHQWPTSGSNTPNGGMAATDPMMNLFNSHQGAPELPMKPPIDPTNLPYNMFGGQQAGLSMGYPPLMPGSQGQAGLQMGGGMNAQLQQTPYAIRPQFGMGGGNLGSYNGGYAGKLKT